MPDDPQKEETLEKKALYISDQIDALKRAYRQLFPGEGLLICYHIAENLDGLPETLTKDGFTHTEIHEMDFAKAIFTWSKLLSRHDEEEGEDDSTSWTGAA